MIIKGAQHLLKNPILTAVKFAEFCQRTRSGLLGAPPQELSCMQTFGQTLAPAQLQLPALPCSLCSPIRRWAAPASAPMLGRGDCKAKSIGRKGSRRTDDDGKDVDAAVTQLAGLLRLPSLPGITLPRLCHCSSIQLLLYFRVS